MCVNPSCAGLSDCPTCEDRATAAEHEADIDARHNERCRKIVVDMLTSDLKTAQASIAALRVVAPFRDVTAEMRAWSDKCRAIKWAISFLSDDTICVGGC